MNYFLEISLNNFEPDCWRLIRVSEHHSLYDIHQIIQAGFNWLDSETFSFLSDGDDLTPSDYELPFSELGIKENQGLTYVYSTNKDWTAQLVVREIQDGDSNPLPLCVDGQIAAPYAEFDGPEDFKSALKNHLSVRPVHGDEMVERIQQWDPQAFGVDFVNLLLYYRLAGFPSGSFAFPPIPEGQE